MEATKPYILIVDDMPINIQILARALKSQYNVKVATKGQKALELAASDNPPDLILLDIMMPEMDGYEVIRRLKNESGTRRIPVIFITAKGEVEDESKGFAMGAVDYITKPFRLPVVEARVKTQIELKLKTEMLEKLVALDGLTNIANRRRLEEVLKIEWKRAVRNKQPLSVALIDIDWFKNYNDLYGHTCGDTCLKTVATSLQQALVRPADLMARYGGEEFMAVLPETDAKGAAKTSTNLCKHIAALKIPHADSQTAGHITVSIGAATIHPNPKQSLMELFEAADKMLYEAKQDGRNQVQTIDLG